VSGFADVRLIRLPRAIAEETQQFLRAVGNKGMEGLALWVGRRAGPEFEVTHLLIPRQRAIRTADGVCAVVEPDELHRINVELFQTGLRTIAQVHSHPSHAYHSDTDDDFAIANTVGCLSLVVPNFAAGDFDLRHTATYRLTTEGVWEELALPTVTQLLQIV
jgi:hypothetical protein